MNDNNENTFSHPRAVVNEQGEVVVQQVPPIGDQAFETAQRMIAENAPKQKAPQARTLDIDPKTGAATVRQADGTVAPASPHQLKIVLLQTATLELQRKGLRPDTRNFRRMFRKRTGYGFEQLRHEIRAESEQFIARLAQAAAAQSGMLPPAEEVPAQA